MNNNETEIAFGDLHRIWIKSKVDVVHCGAHLAEELEDYEELGWGRIIWIEANPRLIPALSARVANHSLSKVINAALWSESNKSLKLKIASNSYSSSILNFGNHSKTRPDIIFLDEIAVQSTTLNSVLSNYGYLNKALLVLDLQGVELDVLHGAVKSLQHFDFIYTEVAKGPVYEDQKQWSSITKFLAGYEFKLVDWQYSRTLGWGNALYQRNPKKIRTVFRRLHRKFTHTFT